MLTVHRAERADTLADALAQVLRSSPGDPFDPDVVAVPAKGVERWLGQRLSSVLGAAGHGDGVAANIEFPSPAALVDRVVGEATGIAVDADPWQRDRLIATVLAAIDASIREPWAAMLARHLGAENDSAGAGVADEERRGRRWAVAAHVADLFRGYASQRPQLVLNWAAGIDDDGAGEPLPEDLMWQPRLWRAVAERAGVPSVPERLQQACERVAGEPDCVDLPQRLSVFGPTRLTVDQLRVLRALGEHRDVHLWLPHPSPALWEALGDHEPVTRRHDDQSVKAANNPLLASLARDVRELQSRFGERSEHHGGAQLPQSLLGGLQGAIRGNEPPKAVARLDGSVQVHACHGPARQVEVLREALLHAFADDPTLQPRDVVVMCPDIETFAPLIRAAFGQGVLGHPGHQLRVRLADRGLRQTNPVLAVVGTLVELADARVTASQVLDLLAAPPVRCRFGLSDEDLERLAEWTDAAGARWGLGQRQRAAFGLDGFEQNTFATAIDRILLGVAADETRSQWLGRALPLDDVGGDDIELAGKFAEFADRLAAIVRDLQGPATAEQWQQTLARGLEWLTDVPMADAWQLAQAQRELGALTMADPTAELRLADVRAMLAQRLAPRPTRSNFRTGELTVCTMVPMRSVPHRVVALIGLDDDVFPRAGAVDGDNVLARNPLVGERDLRSEDRQLLLDAVMAATEKLICCYSGTDPVTGARKAPAIPLAEIIDAVAATAGVEAGDVARHHPLQPFHPSNFDAKAPFSFDTAAYQGALSDLGDKVPERPVAQISLPAADAGDINLAELAAFLVQPAQGLLRQRLGIRITDLDEDIIDALSIELDGLQKWSLGDRMLATRLAGHDLAEFRGAEWRRGTLPPFQLGQKVLTEVTRAVDHLVDAAQRYYATEAESFDVSVDFDGRRLTGTVTDVRDGVVVRTIYSRLGAKHRLDAWVKLLALKATHADREWKAVTLGRGPYRTTPAWRSELIAPENAAELLAQLIDLRDRGLRQPMPIPVATAAEYANRRHGGSPEDEALDGAAKTWSDMFGEWDDRFFSYVLGGTKLPFTTLTADEPWLDERRWSDDTTRFGVLAYRVWAPLLDAESLGRP
ncbi:exodeoxyribonuclease V subunit gamma [Jongsikchunia kroppenstedtii]|uniref:exodeoxyribonuclease V subunit gamma n=1 Tax=Jongsikchunia kroppenstedtii TaxID=1121721 RepID=UPI000376D717|nr:exodeoxyribonuclease V subunit gamma [Jongsikchunia kroppenstedtii]